MNLNQRENIFNSFNDFFSVVCADGECLYSCATEGDDQEADIENLQSSCPLSNMQADLR